MCFFNKYNAWGNMIQQKAQLVAKSYLQMAGEDFEGTYAVVV